MAFGVLICAMEKSLEMASGVFECATAILYRYQWKKRYIYKKWSKNRKKSKLASNRNFSGINSDYFLWKMAFFCYVRHFLTDICDFRRGADSVKHPDFQWYLDGALENITHCATTFDFKIEKHLKTKRVLQTKIFVFITRKSTILQQWTLKLEYTNRSTLWVGSNFNTSSSLCSSRGRHTVTKWLNALAMHPRSRHSVWQVAGTREYYYKKNDIYHPELNPNGMIEKKFKNDSC